MRKTNVFVLTIITALLFSACGAPPENKPANTNTNTAKPLAAAPTTDVLLDMEKKANEAYAKGDSAYFEGMLSDKTMMSMGKEHMNKAAIVAMIKTAKCDLTDGVKLSDPQMSRIDNDTYAFAYRNDTAGKCSENGKMVEQKPMRAATVWVRNGEKWQAAWHGETLIIEPKSDAKKDETKKDTAKMDDAKKDVAKDVVKKEEPKKEDAMKDTAKKVEPKKEEAKKDDKMAANSAPAEAPKPDANTEALVKIHTSGWEAWKAKDAKKLEDISTNDLSIVDPTGMWVSGKAAVVKSWTTDQKCEGVTNVKVSDGFASAISPTVEVLTLKGTSDGTCNGQKNGSLWQSAVYVKEGNDWKLAFMFEAPAK